MTFERLHTSCRSPTKRFDASQERAVSRSVRVNTVMSPVSTLSHRIYMQIISVTIHPRTNLTPLLLKAFEDNESNAFDPKRV